MEGDETPWRRRPRERRSKKPRLTALLSVGLSFVPIAAPWVALQTIPARPQLTAVAAGPRRRREGGGGDGGATARRKAKQPAQQKQHGPKARRPPLLDRNQERGHVDIDEFLVDAASVTSSEDDERRIHAGIVACLKAVDVETALQLYDASRERGYRMPKSIISGVLGLWSTDPAGATRNGRDLLSQFIAAGIRPQENTYSLIVRESSTRGAFDEAFAMVKDMVSQGLQPRLRTYAPLLEALVAAAIARPVSQTEPAEAAAKPQSIFRGLGFARSLNGAANGAASGAAPAPPGAAAAAPADATSSPAASAVNGQSAAESTERGSISNGGGGGGSRMSAAWEVWCHMLDRGVVPTADLYVTLLRGFAQTGELWERVADGTVDGMLRGLSDSALELPEELLDDLENSFNLGLSCDAPAAQRAEPNPATGVCGVCRSQLHAVGLSPGERIRVRDALFELAGETEEPPAALAGQAAAAASADASEDGSGEGGKAAVAGLRDFYAWLQERPKPFTVVVDAPNIAYFGQNVFGGCFRMEQVATVVSALEAAGERVLVVCPHRYLANIIPNSTRFGRGHRRRSTQTEAAMASIAEWRRREMLYEVPGYFNDDWFWMLMTVAVEDGPPATVVSNDRMRDHRLALLEPVPFARWRATQVRRFYMECGGSSSDAANQGEFDWMQTAVAAGAATSSAAAAAPSAVPAANTATGEAVMAEVISSISGSSSSEADLPPQETPSQRDAGIRPIVLEGPPLFTRDVQRTDGGIWHLPLSVLPAPEEAAEMAVAAERMAAGAAEGKDVTSGGTRLEGSSEGGVSSSSRGDGRGSWLCVNLAAGLAQARLRDGGAILSRKK